MKWTKPFGVVKAHARLSVASRRPVTTLVGQGRAYVISFAAWVFLLSAQAFSSRIIQRIVVGGRRHA